MVKLVVGFPIDGKVDGLKEIKLSPFDTQYPVLAYGRGTYLAFAVIDNDIGQMIDLDTINNMLEILPSLELSARYAKDVKKATGGNFIGPIGLYVLSTVSAPCYYELN